MLAQRLEIGRQSGVPETALDRYAERFQKGGQSGVARVIEPDQLLLDGVKIETDLGEWTTYETPGHAPSHVCLFAPERRLLISGDHVLGRAAPEVVGVPAPVDQPRVAPDEVRSSIEVHTADGMGPPALAS